MAFVTMRSWMVFCVWVVGVIQVGIVQGVVM